MNTGYFTSFIKNMRQANKLIVQPRMGFGTCEKMQIGLQAVKSTQAPTIGTITLDSYTRVNNYKDAQKALDEGHDLNGYPIVNHGEIKTRAMLQDLQDEKFPVQVRHGTALPLEIFKAILASGIDATEGGPVSYCLPYSRVSLQQTMTAWAECCKLLANQRESNMICHLESFAGCMLGQLCHPSLLIALSILEGLFFKKYGLVSVSLSFAQGTHSSQDLAALSVLRRLAKQYLNDIEWHVVVYTYMGVFPKTVQGAYDIIQESARVAKLGCAERLIVKTPAEAHRIPTIEENIASLEITFLASEEIKNSDTYKIDIDEENKIFQQASYLIESVLNLEADLDKALLKAFEKGYLDVPYCLHQDNKNKSRTYIDKNGYLQWADVGCMPFPDHKEIKTNKNSVSSDNLLYMLSYIQQRFDNSCKSI